MMTTYNYNEAMTEDVREYIKNEIDLTEYTDDRDGLEEFLNDELWTVDSVTGNASGSYTFNRYTSKEYLDGNEEILVEALENFDTPSETIAEKFLSCDWEYFDVTIRCYLVGSVISEVLDEMEGNGDFDEEEED